MTETGSRNKRESRVNVDLGRGLRVPASANSRQPQAPQPHQNFMQFPRLHPAWLLAVALPLATITACNTKDNPDEIRRRTAEATETMRRDAKAVAEGVKEGMARDKKTININRASREDLLSLPGLTEHEADHIIAERPYDNTDDLVTRHVLPRAKYDKISDHIIAGH